MRLTQIVPPTWEILLSSNVLSGSITAIRSGDLVTVDLENVKVSTTEMYVQTVIGTLPYGLRSARRALGEVSKASSISVKWTIRVEGNGIRVMRNSVTITDPEEELLGQFTFRTNDPMPT